MHKPASPSALLRMLFVAGTLSFCWTTVEAQGLQEAARESTTVVLLGTGMPRPDPNASGPAVAVIIGNRVFLVDGGPGTERQFTAAHLPINGVTALFITHLHSDHTLGYPDLIFTSWVMGRKAPLQAYGPHGSSRNSVWAATIGPGTCTSSTCPTLSSVHWQNAHIRSC